MQTKSFRNSYQLRPIEITDAEQIHAMHQRTSSDSLYFRYMRSYQPNYRDAQSIVAGKGLVIIHEGAAEAIIGYAYYVANKNKPFEAEFAMLLEDAYQGHGLGRYLLNQLCRYASSNGIETQRRHSWHKQCHEISHTQFGLSYTVVVGVWRI